MMKKTPVKVIVTRIRLASSNRIMAPMHSAASRNDNTTSRPARPSAIQKACCILSTERYIRVYPGFPTLFWGLSVFFVGDLMGKALWKLVENAQRFPRRGGRVLCVHGAVSFHRARPCGPRWLPGREAMRHVELDRRVLGLQSTDE